MQGEGHESGPKTQGNTGSNCSRDMLTRGIETVERRKKGDARKHVHHDLRDHFNGIDPWRETPASRLRAFTLGVR